MQNLLLKCKNLWKEISNMSKTLTINPDVLRFYVDNAEIPFDLLQEKCPHIIAFLNGDKSPTFNQLSEVAKKLNVPTGLLMLPTEIEIENKSLEFRTVGSVEVGKMSENLRDMITDMKKKQDFLRDMVEEKLSFIGAINIQSDIASAVKSLRELLDIPLMWQKEVAQNSDAFKFFRSKISELGIYVFLDGFARQNTRTLDTKEFRGFMLVDEKAPIIFINSTDSNAGRLFTLIHEFVHLLLGSAGIVNKIYLDTYSFNPVEAFANRVTAEILVPKTELLEKNTHDIPALSRVFKVSEYVIARRLLDCAILSNVEYQSYVSKLTESYEVKKSTEKKSASGNYYNSAQFKIDKTFFHTVKNAIYSDIITYTKAFDILGMSQRAFKGLETKM